MRRRKLAVVIALSAGCGRADPAPPPAPVTAAVTQTATLVPASASAGEPPSAPPEPPEPPAPPAQISVADAARIDAAARGAIDRGEIPGCVALIVAGDRTLYHRAYGLRAKEPAQAPMKLDAVFDLASLTKPIATAASIALLAERGKLALTDRAAKHLPGFEAHGKGDVTVEQLLLHTSGLPADNPLADYAGDRGAALARTLAVKLETAPGEAFRYSDVGYIALGEIVGRASSAPLDAFSRAEIFSPLGMQSAMFTPPPATMARAAPTEKLGDTFLIGRVHDPRARALGGVAGHAGLFATAADLGLFARMLLNGGELSGHRVLSAATVRSLLEARDVPGGRRAYLGAVDGSAVSHTGFTGTSLWIDPQRKIAVVILSNRVHPDGEGDARRLRREVIEASVTAAMSAKTAGVKAGVDVLVEGGFAELKGRKVALLTHAAGRTAQGKSTIDVLRSAPGVTLVSLLSPEHGLRSSEEGHVADSEDASTGLPIHSLYGAAKRPERAMLEGADTIVVDLQDAGARFYTYETTLGYTLEAAAKIGVRVVVLDRPNPTGGVKIEGPLLDAGRESMVAYDRVPVRHGMTLGELARMWNAEKKLGCDLTVIAARGWTRGALFADTGLPWTPPSPNLKSAAAALLYPGVGLVELTNVSVGRGTARPFEQIGAPWIDADMFVAALREAKVPGVAITKTTFTPASSVFAGEACQGAALRITAPNELDAVRLGVAIAVALRRTHAAMWRPSGLLTLLGHQRAYEAITAGEPLSRVLATFEEETSTFAARRRPHLLY